MTVKAPRRGVDTSGVTAALISHEAELDFAAAADRCLRDLRERVGLDSWWIARRSGDDQVVLAAVDDVFGRPQGTVSAWSATLCSRMLEDGAPQAAPRLADVPEYASTLAAQGVLAASGLVVPITAPSGAVLATLCALGRQEQPDLADALPTVFLQARLLGALLSHELRLADEVRRAERAEQDSLVDALTDVGNRRCWDAALAAEEARAARYAGTVSVVVLDLDGLKAVNDRGGHGAGDDLLRMTATLLTGRLRASDVLARLGGDEFGILLPETDLAGALVVVEELRGALAASGIRASFGVAGRRAVAGGDDGLQAAWRQADAAMYLEKASGAAGLVDVVPALQPPVSAAARTSTSTSTSTSAGTGASSIDTLLRIVKDQLGADVAFVSTLEGEDRSFRNIVSDEALPFGPGFRQPLEGTHCKFVLDGTVGPVTPDLSTSIMADLPINAALDLGSYVGIPLRRKGGEVYGTLCTVSHRADPGLRDRDAGILSAIAGAVMTEVEAEEGQHAVHHAVLGRLDALFAAGGPSMVFQPVITLEGLQAVGVEALSRFPHGSSAPDRWFAEADAAGVGTALELSAVTNALAALPRLDGFLALNASAATATTPAFLTVLADQPLHRLVLEITEHEAVEDYTALTNALAPLRQRGLRIAVDDTGAGFASMRHVLALVPDLIKLDISLVRGIDTDLARQALAAALATFAATTGAKVIAEGVETERELECLRRLGIDYGQGYHLARPAPLG